jgi:hypothetical protein
MKKRQQTEIREIDGIPVCVGGEKIARFRRGKRPKSPMAELGFEKLKPKQKQALINKFEHGMSSRRAAIQAGYSPTNAWNVIPTLLRRKPIVDELERIGVTDKTIAKVIADAMTAQHPFRPKQPDHSVRLKAVHEANVTKDNYPAKKIEIEEKAIHLHFTNKDYENYKKYKQLTEKENEKH